MTAAGYVMAAIQVVLGLGTLVTGLRSRGSWGAPLAPLGVMFLVPGLGHFLDGSVPEGILIPVEIALFTPAVVWFVRAYRTARARTRELLRQRGQVKP